MKRINWINVIWWLFLIWPCLVAEVAVGACFGVIKAFRIMLRDVFPTDDPSHEGNSLDLPTEKDLNF